MQFIKTIAPGLFFLLMSYMGTAQSTLLPQNNKFQQMLDRIEIKAQRDSVLNLTFIKPYNRMRTVQALDKYYTNTDEIPLTTVDKANLSSFMANNYEWVEDAKTEFASKRPVWNTFYKTKANLFIVDSKDFFLAVDPMLQFQISKEKNNSETVFLNTRGLTARGLIAGKIGFDFYLAENQERLPGFGKRYVDSFNAVPGVGFYKSFKTTAYDYFDARGSIYFNVAKYVDVQFGYDKNFYGNGFRSMLLSDFTNGYLFLKLTTNIWKLQYQNLFMELIPQQKDNPGNLLLDRKYAAMHRLGMNVTPWLNIGVYESVVFGRANRFDFSYLIPVIFLRSIEQQNGSPDNANIGIDFKANIAKRVQLYGQIMFDEFKLSEMTGGKGWWGNKFGIQAGGKYIDVFGIKNLDVQGEINLARPFTYSHYDVISNYSHYNQPLAHPMGANFAEFIGIVRYQPLPKWRVELKAMAWKQGLDSAGMNYGSNIFNLYTTRPEDYGFKIGSGAKSTVLNASAWIGYEVLENLFIDASFLYRKQSVPAITKLSGNTNMFTLGLRLNMFRRTYDF